MNVYEVIYEYSPGDSKEITQEVNYWTGPDIKTVMEYALEHGYQYEKDLQSVRYVLTVTQRVKPPRKEQENAE